MNKKQYKENDEVYEAYLRQVKSIPLLSFEEELELSRQIQKGDKDALHKLVKANLRLVIKIAATFNVYDISFLDIVQEGNMGLIHAAEKYDHRKNVRFCTYASWWVRQFINRYITKKRRIVRLPMKKEETLRKIQKAYHVLCQTLMHQPNNTEIAKELGFPVQEVDSVINMTVGQLSIDPSNVDIDFSGMMDSHIDYTYCPEKALMRQYSKDGTMRVLNKLKDKEKRIISYRYQLNGCEHRTLREIGDKLHISPETVRQIEIRALNKIRLNARELKECVYEESV
jgi:RNA polymerase primary sigma factor